MRRSVARLSRIGHAAGTAGDFLNGRSDFTGAAGNFLRADVELSHGPGGISNAGHHILQVGPDALQHFLVIMDDIRDVVGLSGVIGDKTNDAVDGFFGVLTFLVDIADLQANFISGHSLIELQVL